MKPGHYLLFGLLAAIVATLGSDIVARITFGGGSVGSAGSEHLKYAFSGWVGTLVLYAPFLVVGSSSAVLYRKGRTRGAIVIFALGSLPLFYFYFEGYFSAQQAMADESWTAAALSIGLLPFFIGIPVILLVILASAVALSVEDRMPD